MAGHIQVTINPIDLNNNRIGDGLSAFVDARRGSYVHFRLPRELFEQSVRAQRRFLVSLVDKNQQLVLKGPDTVGTTQDPMLTIEHDENSSNEAPGQPRIIENNYYNIKTAGDYVAGNKTVNNATKEGIPSLLRNLILSLIVTVLGGFLLYIFGWSG